MVDEIFLLDANTFITPYLNYYPFDFAPSYWKQLTSNLYTREVLILDSAKDEVLKGKDDLSLWLKGIPSLSICNHKDSKIFIEYSKVLRFLQDSPLYTDKALRTWSRAEVADPWLIAAASAYGFTLITFEKSAGIINPSNPSGKPKIPDIARNFGVRCESLFYFMRKKGIIL